MRRADGPDGVGLEVTGGDPSRSEGSGVSVHRHRRRREELPDPEDPAAAAVAADPLSQEKVLRRKKKVTRNVSEQTVQLSNGQSIPENEVDAGLFKSLMDMGRSNIRRNGERRRSTKVR